MQWQPSQRYPDPRSRSSIRASPSTGSTRQGRTDRVRHALGEGPVWFGDGRYLLWSDIPNNRIMRWDEETGAVSVFRKPVDISRTATPATGRGGC